MNLLHVSRLFKHIYSFKKEKNYNTSAQVSNWKLQHCDFTQVDFTNIKKCSYNQRKRNFKIELVKHIVLNIQLKSRDSDKLKKSKKSIDHTIFLKCISNNWCKNVSDEIDKNIALGKRNIIQDVIAEDNKN